MRIARSLAAGIAIATFASLAGCGFGTSGAPIESAGGGGGVAAVGVQGVEVAFTNPYEDVVVDPATGKESVFYRIGLADGSGEKLIGPTETASFQEGAEDDGIFVVTGPFSDSSSSFEIGFANPSSGCPNATVDGWKRGFCQTESTNEWVQEIEGAGRVKVQIERLANSGDRTRYAVSVWWTP